MIDAFGIEPAIASKHEQSIAEAYHMIEKRDGHKGKMPPDLLRHAWGYGISATDHRVLTDNGSGKYNISEIARRNDISQKRVKQILESRRPWAKKEGAGNG